MSTENNYNGRSIKERKEAIEYLHTLEGDIRDVAALSLPLVTTEYGYVKAQKEITFIELIDTSTEEGAADADELIDNTIRVLENMRDIVAEFE